MYFRLSTFWRSWSAAYRHPGKSLKARLALGSLLLVVALTGRTVVGTALSEHRMARTYQDIATTYHAATQALYAAEAGLEEARGRLRLASAAWHIGSSADPDWQVTLHTTGAPEVTSRTIPSLQEEMHYNVHIQYATTADRRILRWGDDDHDGIATLNPHIGEPLYRLTSQGFAGAARRTIIADVVRIPPLPIRSVFYTGDFRFFQEPYVTLNRLDHCGTDQQAGMHTPLLYCSEAIQQQTRSMPLQVLRWQEIVADAIAGTAIRQP